MGGVDPGVCPCLSGETIPDCPVAPTGEKRGRCLWRKDTSPCDPLQKRGGISISTPSRHCDSRPLWGRQSRRFLETGSLHPPLAALRLFPPHPLTTQREGAAAPPLWKPHPGGAGRRTRKQVGTPKCGGRLPLFRLWWAHPVGDYQVTWAPATATKRFAVNLTRLCQVDPLSAFSFGP